MTAEPASLTLPSSDPVAKAVEEQQDELTDGLPRKRLRRKPINCAECRRRKTKCDRQVPCSECIKRGEANLCHGGLSDAMLAANNVNNARRVFPHTTPYSDRHFAPANAAVVESLAKRVCALEKLLSRIPNLSSIEPVSVSPDSGGISVQMGECRDDDVFDEDGLEYAVNELEQAALEHVGEPALVQNKKKIAEEIVGAGTSPSAPGSQQRTTSIWLKDPSTSRVAHSFNRLSPRASAVQALVIALPPSSTCRHLLQAFLRYVDQSFHYTYSPTFLVECEQFLSLDRASNFSRLDPAWLAVFTNALARGFQALKLHGPLEDLDPHLHVDLHAFSQLALVYAEWTTKPQARVIQTLIGMVCFLSHAGSPFFADAADIDLGAGEHCRVLLGIAVSLARQLALDRLTPEATLETHLALGDVVFPFPGPSSLHTELCRRWWWSLVALDAKSCLGRSLPRHIPPGSFTTPVPSRTKDSSLGQHMDAAIESPTEVSDADGIIYQSYLVQLIDNSPVGHPTYEQILDLDALWRPHFLQLLGTDVGDAHLLLHPTRGHTKAILSAALHARLLRIHRPFYLKGIRSERYSLSAQTCITCAQVILAAYASPTLLQQESGANHWFGYQHVTSATTVLVLAHLYRARHRSIPTVGGEKDDNGLLEATKPARDFFNLGLQSSSQIIRATAQQCLRILEPLWRVRPEDLVDEGRGSSQEPLVQLLRRVSRAGNTEGPPSHMNTSGSPSVRDLSTLDELDASFDWAGIGQHRSGDSTPLPYAFDMSSAFPQSNLAPLDLSQQLAADFSFDFSANTGYGFVEGSHQAGYLNWPEFGTQ